ncbi:MAG: FtsQ-type POTRA domain-containing protein [Clostridia bacterium]|nr:FtsQ-type POTRA domain-containing protein [Clostridia bacterium]
MTAEERYGRPGNAGAARPVFYVYPDGLFTRAEKRARMDRRFGERRTERKAEERPAPRFEIPDDEAASRDFYVGENEKPAEKKLPRGEYDPRDFRNNTYKVGFDSPEGGRVSGGATFAARPRDGGMNDRKRDDIDDARKKAADRRRFVIRKRGWLLALMVILFTVLLLFLGYKFIFVVRSISVDGSTTYSAEEIIEASGVRFGLNLFSFRASAANSRVTFRCPYVESVKVKRTVPSTVTLTVTEDVPRYTVEIFGEVKIISDGLRVLGTVREGDAVPEGLIRLKLPAVEYSVEGRLLGFADAKDDRAVRTTLEALEDSELSERVSSVDFRNPFGITAACDGKYLLIVGNSTDVDKKLKAASLVLEDQVFSEGTPARIDLSDTTKASVVFDDTISFD